MEFCFTQKGIKRNSVLQKNVMHSCERPLNTVSFVYFRPDTLTSLKLKQVKTRRYGDLGKNCQYRSLPISKDLLL